MVNGAILDLVAKGKQDEDLISTDLDKSIFLKSFKKTTNFSKGSVRIIPNGDNNWGQTIKFTIPKHGDLLGGLYFVCKLPSLDLNDLSLDLNKYRIMWQDFIGNILINEVRLFIGGKLIDKQTGEYMQLVNDIYDSTWSKKHMLGQDDVLNKPNIKLPSEYIYVPLKFWFCDKIENALPIISLQYQKIEIEINLRNMNECYNILKFVDNTSILQHTDYVLPVKNLTNVGLEADFIYLGSEERKKVAKFEGEILIQQVQHTFDNLTNRVNLELDFNHPVKDLLFYIQSNDIKNSNELFNFSGTPKYLPKLGDFTGIDTNLYDLLYKKHLLDKGRIIFNNMERLEYKDYKYFHYIQNYENYRTYLEHYVYLYSFSNEPKKFDPTGTINFSRIDNAELQIQLNNNSIENIGANDTLTIGPGNSGSVLNVFAHNYNFLVFKNGLAGLKYIN